MDQNEFVLAIVIVVVVAFLVWRFIRSREAAEQRKSELELAKYKNYSARQQKNEPNTATNDEQVGKWVGTMLSDFGLNPDVIFEQNMPPELKTFLPIIKGYVNAQGGLPGIIAKMSAGAQQESGGGYSATGAPPGQRWENF
jgi:hypothetical protein